MAKSSSTQFTGNKTYKLDPKGRVSFPSNWKAEENCIFKIHQAQREGFSLLKCYTEASFEDTINTVRVKAEEDGYNLLEIDAYVGSILGNCFDAELNAQGKLQLSKEQRAQLGAEDQVLMVGRGKYFELWNAADYDQVYHLTELHKLELNKKFGIFS